MDEYGRAQAAHIQLQKKDQPQKQREPRLSYNPSGWHNYKFYYEDGSKRAWIFNRGHLIGYQFSGLNDEPRNLIAITTWLNTGNYKGSNADNIDSMFYYEKKLGQWLSDHPNDWLDYRVTPIYSGAELVPRQVELQYVGLTSDGQLIPISLGGKETIDADRMSHVLLDNITPNATIDYLTGQATPTVESFQVQQAQSANNATQQTPNPSPTAENDPIVYIARNGEAEVYWYSKDNMPANTNLNKVIEMYKSEAEALGKRHTTKE